MEFIENFVRQGTDKTKNTDAPEPQKAGDADKSAVILKDIATNKTESELSDEGEEFLGPSKKPKQKDILTSLFHRLNITPPKDKQDLPEGLGGREKSVENDGTTGDRHGRRSEETKEYHRDTRADGKRSFKKLISKQRGREESKERI